jgi:acyl-CoA thioester hydrolase
VVRSLIRKISPLRFEFQQDVYRLPDEKLMLTASITGTSLNQEGRPFIPGILSQLFVDN